MSYTPDSSKVVAGYKINVLDKVKHLILLCGVYMVFGLVVAITTAIIIELVQAEAGIRLCKWKHIIPACKKFIKNLWTVDTGLDLLADGIGIGIGYLIVNVL